MKLWAQMTWEEIKGLNKETLVILPLGSVEQHGQRLPVITDTLFANHWAKQVAERIENSVLLPSQNYGMSWHHTAFPGTISLDPATYVQVIRDILKSIIKHGFQKILIVNAHGGNQKWIEQAVTEIRETYPGVTISNPVIEVFLDNEFKKLLSNLSDEDPIHAGAMEVSMYATIAPDGLSPATVVTDIPSGTKFGEGTNSPSQWKEKFPKGQKGNQRICSIDAGKEMNEFALQKLLETAKQMMG